MDKQTTVNNESLPDAGTGTGVTDTYGADLGCEATNSHGKITGQTNSDKPGNMPGSSN